SGFGKNNQSPHPKQKPRYRGFCCLTLRPVPMSRTLGIIAAISGFICVALGAFGAHGLKETLSPAMMDTWQTAVTYQFFHTLVLLMLAFAPVAMSSAHIHRAGLLFAAGILVFSGSLYTLVLLDA